MRPIAKPLIDGLVLDMDLSMMLPTVNRGRIGDRSIKGNHGTVYGRPAGAFVAATDDYASREDSILTQFPFTVAGWFNTSNAAFQAMFWCGDKDDHSSYFSLSLDQGDVVVDIASGVANTGVHIAALDDGANHHVAVVCYVESPGVSVDFYVDGEFAETINSASWSATHFSDITGDRTAIGRAMDSTPSHSFDGNLWNWYVYDGHQATAAEVERIYNGYALASPSAIWRFSKGTASTIFDTSGNSLDLTAVGMGWDMGANGGDLGVTAAGREFDRADDLVSIADAANLRFGTGDFQIHVWANFSSIPTDVECGLVDKGRSAGEWWLYFKADGTVAFQAGVFVGITVAGAVDYRDDTWHLVSAVRHGTDFSLLVDGAVIGSDASSDIDLDGMHAVGIGAKEASDNPFKGTIKRVRIATATRTIAEATLDALAIFKRGVNG